MFQPSSDIPENKTELYQLLLKQLGGLFEGERDFLANAANMASLVFHTLPDLNWAGFYFLGKNELVLGPFQGRPACVRIPLGRGVCGSAADGRRTLVVADVHEFPGHIACDAASNAEIVVPLVKNGRLWGVLDLDSPTRNRFNEEDQAGLEKAVEMLLDASEEPVFE